MKQVAILITLACLHLTAGAQKRYVDLELAVDSPRHNTTVFIGDSVAVNTVLTNMGPDTLLATDSLALMIFTNSGTILLYYDGTQPRHYLHGYVARKTAPGDTIHLNGPRIHWPSMAYPRMEFCIRVKPYTDSLNSIWYYLDPEVSDTAFRNNDSCVTANFAFATSVENVDSREDFKLTTYPNPARYLVNFEVELLKPDDLIISVTDIVGRVVASEQKVNLPKGKQVISVDTRHIAGGVYLYRVSTDSKAMTGKLLIE